MTKKLLLLLLVFGFNGLPVFAESLAESLSVSIRVGETILTFSGKASPEAQITFLEDGAVVGTIQADENGDFSKSLTYFEEGVRTVNIYATDSQNRTTSTVSYSVSLTLGVNTTVGNIILPATIVISPSSLTAGEILTVSGEAVASSTVNLFFSNSATASVTASSQGIWQYSYDTSSLDLGDYTVYVKTSTGDGYLSEKSETKTFSVSFLPTATPTPTSGPTSTPGPGPTSTPGPAASATPTPVSKTRLILTLTPTYGPTATPGPTVSVTPVAKTGLIFRDEGLLWLLVIIIILIVVLWFSFLTFKD